MAWQGLTSGPTHTPLLRTGRPTTSWNRTYTLDDDSEKPRLVCQLWMIHYHNATDRRHFPTGCYRGQGYQEDFSERQELAVAGGEAPVEKFCFTKGADRGYVSNVYYWHYTLEPPETVGLSLLQRIHGVVRFHASSLTVQVFNGPDAGAASAWPSLFAWSMNNCTLTCRPGRAGGATVSP